MATITNQNAIAQASAKSLKKARWYADKGDFENAMKAYKDVLKNDSLNFYANLELGVLLLDYVEQPEFAGKYLLCANKILDDDVMPELIYEIGKYYHQINQFEKAESFFKEFENYIALNKDGERIRKHLHKNLLDCAYARNHFTANENRYVVVENAGDEINTIFPEYVPVVLKDKNALIFTSRRGVLNTNENIDYDDMAYFEDVFIASNNNGKFGAPIQFLQDRTNFGNLKNTLFHESVISLSHDGNTMFIYKGQKLWRSEYSNGQWSTPVELNKTINAHYYQNHICLSGDGKTMYYSAESKKSLSGLDIFYSVLDENGKWSEGIKINDNINTLFDEDSPFISQDGKTLYFASNGHPGFGGYDIYKSTFDGKTWSVPVNLGMPFNSPSDDLYYTEYEDGKSGYFASSRTGGKGDLDIYNFKPGKKPLQELIAVNFDLPDKIVSNETVNLKINIISNEILNLKVKWMLNDSVIGYGNQLPFKFAGNDCKISAMVYENEDDYVLNSIEVHPLVKTQPDISNNGNIIANNGNSINELKIELNKIYFGFDKSELDEQAIIALDNNISILKSNHNIEIVVQSYCDAKGSVNYNKVLSSKRSNSVVTYLRSKGISKRQIRLVENLGEANLVNNCKTNDDCSNEENAPNRRVEFKILEVKK